MQVFFMIDFYKIQPYDEQVRDVYKFQDNLDMKILESVLSKILYYTKAKLQKGLFFLQYFILGNNFKLPLPLSPTSSPKSSPSIAPPPLFALAVTNVQPGNDDLVDNIFQTSAKPQSTPSSPGSCQSSFSKSNFLSSSLFTEDNLNSPNLHLNFNLTGALIQISATKTTITGEDRSLLTNEITIKRGEMNFSIGNRSSLSPTSLSTYDSEYDSAESKALSPYQSESENEFSNEVFDGTTMTYFPKANIIIDPEGINIKGTTDQEGLYIIRQKFEASGNTTNLSILHLSQNTEEGLQTTTLLKGRMVESTTPSCILL